MARARKVTACVHAQRVLDGGEGPYQTKMAKKMPPRFLNFFDLSDRY